MRTFRAHLHDLLHHDEIPVPLAYPQVNKTDNTDILNLSEYFALKITSDWQEFVNL